MPAFSYAFQVNYCKCFVCSCFRNICGHIDNVKHINYMQPIYIGERPNDKGIGLLPLCL
jgi:hypothetical protein